MEFAAWLRGALAERNLRQIDLAFRAGLGLRTIAGWLGGESAPGYPQLLRLVETLGELPPDLAPFCAQEDDEG